MIYSRQISGAPATVSPRGAKTRRLGFENRNVQRRIDLIEVVGRPEAGVTGPNDSDIRLGVTGKGWPRLQGSRYAVMPKAQFAKFIFHAINISAPCEAHSISQPKGR